jgi:hypothetical protein
MLLHGEMAEIHGWMMTLMPLLVLPTGQPYPIFKRKEVDAVEASGEKSLLLG